MEYYIISTKWTYYQNNIFTFWRPNSNGYTQILERAGVYTEDNTKLDEGILYIEKSIIDKLAKKISGVYNEFGMDSFTVLPNIGDIRKELNITSFDLDKCSYKSEYFGLYFPEKIYEISKTVISDDIYHVKAKKHVDEYWYLDGYFKAENRNKAILKAFDEWMPGGYDAYSPYIEFKKDVTCCKKREIIFDRWSA